MFLMGIIMFRKGIIMFLMDVLSIRNIILCNKHAYYVSNAKYMYMCVSN